MSKCPSGERLGAYLDGELADPAAQAVADHLEACPTCAAELDALRELKQLTSDLAVPEVTDDEWVATWQAIAARVTPAAPARHTAGLWDTVRLWRLALVPAAAAALFALAIGVWGMYNVPPQAQAHEVVVESVETAAGFTSMYYHSTDADVTIITLVPADTLEAAQTDESTDPL